MRFLIAAFLLCFVMTASAHPHKHHHTVPQPAMSETTAKTQLITQLAPICGTDTAYKLITDPRLALVRPVVSTSKGMTLSQFRAYMLSPESVNQGLVFVNEHKELFDKIEATYHVDRYTIAGVLRIETNFGKHVGGAPIMNSLYTQYVKGKSKHRKDVIAQMRAVCLLNDVGVVKPFETPSSPAGAFGITQFMPATYLEYADDGNGDLFIDMFNMTDAVASTANFLRQHGYARSVRKSLHHYNPWGWYVDSVMMYSKRLVNTAHG